MDDQTEGRLLALELMVAILANDKIATMTDPEGFRRELREVIAKAVVNDGVNSPVRAQAFKESLTSLISDANGTDSSRTTR